MMDSIKQNYLKLKNDIAPQIELEDTMDKIKLDILNPLCEILQITAESTLLLEHNDIPTLDKCWPIAQQLVESCDIITHYITNDNETIKKDCTAIVKFKTNLRQKLEEKFISFLTIEHSIASILNPNYR